MESKLNDLLLCIRIQFLDSFNVTCVSRGNSFIVLLSLYSHNHNIHDRQRIICVQQLLSISCQAQVVGP